MAGRSVTSLSETAQDMRSVCQFTASYDSSNKLSSYTPYNSSPLTIGFDQNGNQTQFGDQSFLYDELNRLKTIVGNNHLNYYDANNERVAEIIKPVFITGESTYYLKEGSETLGELHYKRENLDTTSIREKYYLNVAGNILTSSEKEHSFSLTLIPDPGQLPQHQEEMGMQRCLSIYAESSGIRNIVSMSDPVTYSSKGQKYDINYSLQNVTDDLVGIVVRLGRIKDEGSSGSSGDNGNGCPRNDEDKVQFYYFLKDGLDPDFVFNKFGLCGNQDYGQIMPLSSGNTYPITFTDLQKDKKYRVTLYAFTGWQADPNLGYNLMKVEEGSITVPKKEPSTYFQEKSLLREEGNSHNGKIRAKWGSLNGATAYKISAKKNNGQNVLLGQLPSSQTEFEVDLEAIEAMGVSQDSTYQIEGIIGGGKPQSPIVIGPIKGGLVPIICPVVPPFMRYTIPVIKRVYLLYNYQYETTAGPTYVEWDQGLRPSPKYVVYKKIIPCDQDSPEIGDFTPDDVIGITTNNYFVEVLSALPDDNQCAYYAVETADGDGNPVGFESFAVSPDYIDTVGIFPRNTSIGNDQRQVEVNWKLAYGENDDIWWYGLFGSPEMFPEGSGLNFELMRIYSSNGECFGGPDSANRGESDSFSCEDLPVVTTLNEFSYLDTSFNPQDDNPAVTYKVKLKYNGDEIFSSPCFRTNVGFCYDSPQISGFNAYANGDTINVGTTEYPWYVPKIVVNFNVSPPSVRGDYIYEIVVDGDEAAAFYWYDFWVDQTTIQDDVETVRMIGWIDDDAGTTHTIRLRITDPCTGCFSTQEVSVTILPYQADCPDTQEIKAKLNVLGERMDETLGSLLQVQIIWNNASGNTIKIYGSETGYEDDFSLLAEVPSTQYYYIGEVVLGGTMYYKLESALDTGETQCTLCQSAYLQVDASPQATQEGATYYFYVRDHLSNSRLILDSAGNYKTSFNFEPYGVELLPLNDNTGGSGNPLERYKYTGQERDYSTNLDYMHFRYYGSNMGRFLKPDNIIPNAANPQSWNLYSYVQGNPVNFNDPSGHGGPEWMGPTISPHFLVTAEESYFHFRNDLKYSAAASAFFSGLNGLTSTTNAVLGAAGVSGSNVAYANWVSDALVSGFNFDTETIAALGTIYKMSNAYGIELGFYFSRIASNGLAVIVLYGTEKNVPSFMWNISKKSKSPGIKSEYQVFQEQLGFSWSRWFLYGHTHLPGYGISEEDVATYAKAFFANPRVQGYVIEQNAEGQSVISRIGFKFEQVGFTIVLEPFRETWRMP